MQTLQTASSRRVLSELTPSRTNVLQLSFLKRRRASSISHGTEISPQKEVLSEKQLKRFKESDLDLSCSDSESISCDYIDTLSPHAKHYEKQVDMEPNILLEDDCANVHTDCVLKNEKCSDKLELPDSYFSYINKRMLLEPFFISKEQIRKVGELQKVYILKKQYAHILKLRLRLAYYKLQINQPHSEFSALPLSLIPKRIKKNSPIKTSKTILSKTVVSDAQLPSPISSQTHETASLCSYSNECLVHNTFDYFKYNIELKSPPLSEERYHKNIFSSEFTKDVSK
ncbi:uncharacterized protein T551_00297 [Pneumocystis jirovecii RU7]|uniref:Uncharacterized protein n=1 Tax=Pneumocystis jirovecii (strain RU7) TaxID=1408657 RepID=A0A0W4ZWQ7_PNEJ7|nr:uncharacterized protein T551_00297 [Pneumocystis jirovecii RU7]KTW32812.1 hypothetical protein T551_00297 [Pneumocystis jirovecii RU7]